MSSPKLNSPIFRVIPAALALFSAVLYLVTCSPTAFPGASANLIVKHLGLDLFPSLSNVVWGWVVRLIADLVPTTAAVASVNSLSIVCGSLCVALVYLVMMRMPTTFSPAPLVERKHVFQPIRALGAVMASIFLAVSRPYWIVSNRAHTATWDLLLLLLAVYCLFRFRSSRRLLWAWTGCLIFGIGMSGYGTMFVIAPFYGILLLIYLLQNGQLRMRNILLLVVTLLAGLTPWIIHATAYVKTPAYEWQGLKGFGEVLFYMLREEYHSLKFSVPRTGWLIVGLVSILPWLIVLIFRLGQNRKIAPMSRKGGYVLNTLLTALGILLAMDVTFAPWRHGGPQNPTIMPYLLIAMWFGGLTSFWYVELIHHEAGTTARNPRWYKPLGYVVLLIMFGTVGVAAVRNFPTADGRSAMLPRKFVDETLGGLGGREWLLTSGYFEDNLIIAAHERHVPLHVLSLPSGNASPYLRYVSSLFDNPRLRGMAQIGLVPLFNDWTTASPAACDSIAIQNVPDLWFAANRRPLPQGVMYLADKIPPPDAEDLLKRHQSVWQSLESARVEVPEDNPVHPYNLWIVNHAARIANNLGVYLEDAGRGDLAYAAYRQALAFNTNNLSASLNLYTLARRDKKPEADKLEKELKEALKKTDIRRAMWSLSFFHGFVRRPEAYAERGWAWAFSGKPNLGYGEMKRAVELSGDQPGARLAMAGLYFSQDKLEDSEQAYLAVLQKNPTNVPALLGLERVATMKRQYDVARGYLQRLRELKASPVQIQLEEAAMEQTSGNNERAFKILKSVTEENPGHLLAWAALAMLAADINDTKTLDAALVRLGNAKQLPYNIHQALANLALRRNDRVTARKHFEATLALNPTSVQAIEALIRLDVSEHQREDAERHVHRLLAMDSRNILANYVLGSLQVFNGQYALAEASYRACLDAKRSPEILNDLAWVLALQGKYKEALGYSSEAVQGHEQNGNAWDTLGFIQLKLGDIAHAEESLQKAATLMPENLGTMLRIAQVYDAKGMTRESLQLANQLMARAADLDHDTLDELNVLMKRLRQRDSGG